MSNVVCCRRVLTLIALIASLNACAERIDEAVFTEEVKLHDGRMIRVDRKHRRMHGGFPERRGPYLDHELRYAPLGLVWKGSADLRPMSFELFSGVPYLALYARNKDKCGNSYPDNFAATFMKWDNGKWVEISRNAYPVQEARINLLSTIWGHDNEDDPRGLLTWEQKSVRDGFFPDKISTVAEELSVMRYRLCGDGERAGR